MPLIKMKYQQRNSKRNFFYLFPSLKKKIDYNANLSLLIYISENQN